jgi:hypothetical protein
MCDHVVTGAVALIVIVADLVLRNVLRLWSVTIVVVLLTAAVSLTGPMLRLGYFGVPGVELCLSANAQSAYTWLLGTTAMVAGANCLYAVFGTNRSKG